jgi:hypothetical protein
MAAAVQPARCEPWSRLVVLVAIATKTARPRAPPTYLAVLATPDAMPCSWAATPAEAEATPLAY